MAEPFSKDWLLERAHDPQDGVTRVFASVVDAAARAAIQPPNLGMGLAWEKFAELIGRYFPGAAGAIRSAGPAAWSMGCAPLRASEFDDLVALLLEHRANAAESTEWLAYAIASGCMGGNHLYQDMGLPHRQALSTLLQNHFTRLYEKNSGNMKWKKFLYKQLCERAEIRACSAPSCQVCQDYQNCFGPEDDSGLARLSAIVRAVPKVELEPLPGWVLDLPDEYRAEATAPQRYESFAEEESPRACKVLGYDHNGECCYYLHRYALTRVAVDDEDNFYEEEAYFEEVKAWRLAGGAWLRRTVQAGQAGDCRDRSLRSGYAVVPGRPR